MTLRWTRTRPSKEGWYWYIEHGTQPSMVYFDGDYIWFPRQNRDYKARDLDGEWAGPLAPPSEEPGEASNV